MGITVQGVDHVALTVGDQKASEEWYRDVLGLRREHETVWGETPAAMMAHGSGLALFSASRDRRNQLGLRHIAFRVDRENFARAQEHLRERGIAFELQDHGIAHSVYFTDPDGVELELTTYEL